MALDSASKRQAVPGVARPWMRGQFPVAAKTFVWRVSVGLAYPVADFIAAIISQRAEKIRAKRLLMNGKLHG